MTGILRRILDFVTPSPQVGRLDEGDGDRRRARPVPEEAPGEDGQWVVTRAELSDEGFEAFNVVRTRRAARALSNGTRRAASRQVVRSRVEPEPG